MMLRGPAPDDAHYNQAAWFQTLRQFALALNSWLAPLFPEGVIAPEIKVDGWLNQPLGVLSGQADRARDSQDPVSLDDEMAGVDGRGGGPTANTGGGWSWLRRRRRGEERRGEGEEQALT